MLALSINQDGDPKSKRLPLPLTLISLASYLLTHASSVSSPRATAYANLALNILLSFAQNESIMGIFCQPFPGVIRLCRQVCFLSNFSLSYCDSDSLIYPQRLPLLPSAAVARPPLCALLDCCVLWLRHNLHKRLEVHSHQYCAFKWIHLIWCSCHVNVIALAYGSVIA